MDPVPHKKSNFLCVDGRRPSGLGSGNERVRHEFYYETTGETGRVAAVHNKGRCWRISIPNVIMATMSSKEKSTQIKMI